jgi:uncharacterized RmlC-like cupin family protein
MFLDEYDNQERVWAYFYRIAREGTGDSHVSFKILTVAAQSKTETTPIDGKAA